MGEEEDLFVFIEQDNESNVDNDLFSRQKNCVNYVLLYLLFVFLWDDDRKAKKKQ